MKTFDKIIFAVMLVCVLVSVVGNFIIGEISTGIAWINVGIWILNAMIARSETNFYKEQCVAMQKSSWDLLEITQYAINCSKSKKEGDE